jgi:hypothetical protein
MSFECLDMRQGHQFEFIALASWGLGENPGWGMVAVVGVHPTWRGPPVLALRRGAGVPPTSLFVARVSPPAMHPCSIALEDAGGTPALQPPPRRLFSAG